MYGRDFDGMPIVGDPTGGTRGPVAPTGYDPRLDNVSLPADCECEAAPARRPVYWTDGLGCFVLIGSAPADKAWLDVQTVTPAGEGVRRWRVTGTAMVNLNALPYFTMEDEFGVIEGA